MSIAADRTPTRLSVDHEGKWAEVEFVSGLVIASALSSRAAAHEGDVGRTDYDPVRGEQTITFHWGEAATFEIGPDGAQKIAGTAVWERYRKLKFIRDELLHVKERGLTPTRRNAAYDRLLVGEADQCVDDAVAVVEGIWPGWLPPHVREAAPYLAVSSS